MSSVDSRRRPLRSGYITLNPLTLIGSECSECKRKTYPRTVVCPHCRSVNKMKDAVLAADGHLYSFTVVHQAPPDEVVPFILGYVDLPDDVRIMARLRIPHGVDLNVGMPVTLVERAMGIDDGGEVVWYQFEPS